MLNETIVARVLALKSASMSELKSQWRALFQTDVPAYNRHHLESRIAYRVQELAKGGLDSEARHRLETLGDLHGIALPSNKAKRQQDRPIAGTKLIREWNGRNYEVLVRPESFEFEGKPYSSLSSIANLITGTRWNGPVFFGLRSRKGKGKGKS